MAGIPQRYGTQEARERLAARLGLFLDPLSQDWEWEVADPAQFHRWTEVYRDPSLSADERISLMEMLIQCVEEMCPPGSDPADVEARPEWQAVAALLRANSELHADTIRYWCLMEADDLDTADPEQRFHVTLPIRKVWEELRKEA